MEFIYHTIQKLKLTSFVSKGYFIWKGMIIITLLLLESKIKHSFTHARYKNNVIYFFY